jgi:hypothetical protein
MTNLAVMSLEYTFKKNNFEVFIARDGQEALDICKLNFRCYYSGCYDAHGGWFCNIGTNKKRNVCNIAGNFPFGKKKEKDIEKGFH